MFYQKGLSWIIYLVILVAIGALIGGIVKTYNDGVRASAKLDAIERELGSCRKDTLAECVRDIKVALGDCRDKHQKLSNLVAKQNESMSKLEESSRKAQGRAAAAIREADAANTRTLVERERLGALILQGNAPGACPSGEAVTNVRKGLKP